MKPRLFLVGILVGFIPEILNLNDGLDYNAGIVLQLMITMIFFLGYGSNTPVNYCTNSHYNRPSIERH